MITVSPGTTVRLWIRYQENGVDVPDLTDLKVSAYDVSGTAVFTDQTLTENDTLGEYEYSWDTTGIAIESNIRVYFKKGTDYLYSEDYYFDITEDMDGRTV